MPIVKRSIEPIYVSRNKLPKDTKLELECTSTLTLAGVILQLSSLSKHAENLFGELFIEASDLGKRFGIMKDRVEKLNSRMEKMNPEADEEVGARETNLKKFRSRQNAKQQILSRATLPPTLQEQYKRCEPPPNFHRVTPLREDGKDAMKLYTDPDYFLHLWIEGENKDYEQRKKRQRDRREKRKKRDGSKGVSGPTRKVHSGLDKEFDDGQHKKQQAVPSPSLPIHLEEQATNNNHFSNLQVQDQENGLENNPSPKLSRSRTPPVVAPPQHPANPPPSTPYGATEPIQTDSMMSAAGHRHPKRSVPSAPTPAPPSSLPPQPPGASPSYSHPTPATYYQPPPQQPREPSPPPANIPAPPPNLPNVPDDLPPSPPPPADSAIDAHSSMLGEMGAARGMLKTVERKTGPIDARDGLLVAIKQGTILRPVEKRKEEPLAPSKGNDVASILARRIAIEVSDSDSEYDDDYSDDEDWST